VLAPGLVTDSGIGTFEGSDNEKPPTEVDGHTNAGVRRSSADDDDGERADAVALLHGPAILAGRDGWGQTGKGDVERPLPSRAVEGTHLSSQAHQRLQEELGWRSGEHRQEISQWIERAREHGDIRENADYDAAKNEQGHNEARIRQLESILRTAVIVDDAAGDVVAPGVVVEIKMDGDDEAIEYLVGSIEERHETFEVLSVSSPLGQALLGSEVGTVVTYEGPRRTMSVQVVGIRTL
jgi:transcription elongation factor GreA